MNDIEQALRHYRAMAAADAEYPVNDDLAKHRRTAIAALEKQVAKKVEAFDDYMRCPGCSEKLADIGDAWVKNALAYCPDCGQRLEWEE